MALLLFDGFDYLPSNMNNYFNNSGGKWNISANGAPDLITTSNTRYNYGTAIGFGNYIYIGANIPNTTTVIAGFALYTTIGYSDILRFVDATTTQISLYVSADDSSLAVYRNGSKIASSPSNVISTSSWSYIEVKVTFSATVGTVTVRVNNVEVISFTGNTIATTNAYCNIVQIGQVGRYSYYEFDDFILMDGTGSYMNDFQGEERVLTLLPNSDISTQFTRSSGTVSYALLNDTATNFTSYTQDSTSGDTDIFGYSTVSSSITGILGVQVNTVCQKTDSGALLMNNVLATGGNTYTSATKTVTNTTPAILSDRWAISPYTGTAWTPSDINSINAGYKIA